MKRTYALLLAFIMMFSFVACDIGTLDQGSGGPPDSDIDTSTNENQGNDESGFTPWDELDLPVGFPKLADSVDTFRFDESTKMYNFTWKDVDFATSEAMIAQMKSWSDGIITGSVVGKTTNWKIQNDRINLTAAFDEKTKMFTIATQVFEGTTLAAYLSAHTLNEDDFKPANFTDFGEIVTSGEKFGGLTQNGAFSIYIKEGTYNKDDAVAWCTKIIERINEISAANEGTVTDLKNNLVATYTAYAANDGGVPEYPSIGCYFVSELDSKKYVVKIIAGYYAEESEYRVQFTTMRWIP